ACRAGRGAPLAADPRRGARSPRAVGRRGDHRPHHGLRGAARRRRPRRRGRALRGRDLALAGARRAAARPGGRPARLRRGRHPLALRRPAHPARPGRRPEPPPARRPAGVRTTMPGAEQRRLEEANASVFPWKRWDPYLAERQWGTVREDYSDTGEAWEYFPHDHARSRAYRWGEDGIAGISDDKQRRCFAIALWNGADPVLKERLCGLSNAEGNHGEDVKEYYYDLDSTPTHSYMPYL